MITSRFFLWCDHLDCISDAAADYKPDEWFSKAADARRAAKKDGWTRRRVTSTSRILRDYCPKHSMETS